MTGTTDTTEATIKLIADEIEASHKEWEEGRSTSPGDLDFVIYADRILDRVDPNYCGSTPEGRNNVADVLYDHQCNGDFASAQEIAAFLHQILTAQ